MNVTLNDKSTKETRECLTILSIVSDLGSRVSHSDVVAIAVSQYRAQLEQRHPEAAAQLTPTKKK